MPALLLAAPPRAHARVAIIARGGGVVSTRPVESRPNALSVQVDPDTALLVRLRAGDENAFAQVVDAWSPMLLRVARTFVSTDASAQEIVQETWLAVVRGLERFEGRSTLKTWVFSILTNVGRTTGARESRSLPLSSLSPDDEGPTVEPGRFLGAGDEWARHWTPGGAPVPWQLTPEDHVLAGEIRTHVARALTELPERQRVVVALRDVHGMTADEVCDVLEISPENQRVLLHRGRARMRAALDVFHVSRTEVGR
jgi:RNA polymerase sigma-70 factor, ECF subfamily